MLPALTDKISEGKRNVHIFFTNEHIDPEQS